MDAAAEIKSRLSIEDVVSEYVQLKRAGRNFKGLSPWTNEKTPSFVVSPEKQIWHDFSSNRGGDIFSFVMEMEGLDFKGALEHLARKAGVDMDQFKGQTSGVNSQLKHRVLEILALAAKFYQTQLTVNKTVLDYLLKQRHFSKKTILQWQLGYSPNTGDALANFLTKKGFTTDEMKRSGLVAMRATGVRDMFRGRVMIPLADASGAVVGFTARLLADEPDSPKYINTPATIVYDKGRQVFGLHLAKEAIRKTEFVVVAEGNLDVIASHQAGVANVVASAGTAMTENHLKQLKRFTGDVRLSFDTDRAGIAATERMIPLAQKVGVNLSIIDIAGAKDPDELIQRDPKAWLVAVTKASSAPQWLLDNYKSQLDLTTAAGKKAFTDALLPTLRRLTDSVEQEHYLKLVAQLTDTSLEAIRSKLAGQNQIVTPLKRPKIQDQELDQAVIESQKLQDHFLAIALAQPKTRDLLTGLKVEYFNDGPQRQLFAFLLEHPDFKGQTKLASKLQAVQDYVKICALQFEELYKDLPSDDLHSVAANLRHRLINRYVKIQKQKIAIAMSSAKGSELQKLIKKADKLNVLIK